MNLNIQRINMTLHDVPAQIVEQAVSGLQDELAQRLSASRLAANAETMDINVALLALGPLQQGANIDAAALRLLLADQLMQQLQQQINTAGTE